MHILSALGSLAVLGLDPLLCIDRGLLLVFDPGPLIAKIASGLLVAVGLGMVIFFHEVGHFALAKWCGVCVERFSIGFGPILWSRKYGDTEYAISAIPFGGYVKMLGQDDMDPSQLSSEEIARDPRSYSSKSVGQRMAIISAGVTMNVLTAVVFFAIAFGNGIEMPESTIGEAQPGSAAWQAGLKPGDHITEIGGRKIRTFDDIQRAIAFSSGEVAVRGVHQDGSEFEVALTPRSAHGRRMMGVTPAPSLKVVKTREVADTVALLGSPAAAAQPPFQSGDEIVAVNKQKLSNAFELESQLAELRDKPVDFEVRRDGSTATTTVRVEPQAFRRLGLTMDIGKIASVVRDSPAQRNGIMVGDKILRVNNRAVGGDIDPLKLPDYLATLAGQEIAVVVQREVKGVGADYKNVETRLIPGKKVGWLERPREPEQPLSAPAIGAAYYVIPTVLNVTPHSPADVAGVKKGDRIKKAELPLAEGAKSDLLGNKTISIDFDKRNSEPLNWAYVVYLMQLATDRDVVLTLSTPDPALGKADGTRVVPCRPAADPKENWYLPGERGLMLHPLTIMLKSTGVLDAASMGMAYTRNSILDLYSTLRNLLTRDLSIENLHGPLGIATVAYDFARQGLPSLCLFLGFLSVNLAVLNFLPIPVLDGGHMLFLLWEAITRRRPSERVQIAATYVGMAFVLCLALLVFWLDIVVHRVAG